MRSITVYFCMSIPAIHAETIFAHNTEKTKDAWGACKATPSPRQLNNQTFNKTINHNTAVITHQPYPDAVYLEADTGVIRRHGASDLQGNVIIQKNQTVFNADSARYNRKNDNVDARGHVKLSAPNLKLNSTRIQYNLKTQSGTIDQATYEVGKEGANGKSSQIKQHDKDNLTLSDASFSTCPAHLNSWNISSSEIKLNNKTQIGTAKGVKFNIGGVPVAYYPWFSFPLNNQRLSGFLMPSMRLQSGTGIRIPYYLNLAPNYDATLALSTFSNRGIQLNTEFRYLTNKHKGLLEYEVLPEDQSFDDKRRSYFNIQHHTALSDKTNINLRAEGVSDTQYFDSKNESLETSSISSLERRLEIVHNNSPWFISAAIEDYQVLDLLDNENIPYSKLPELKLRYQPEASPKQLNIRIDSESTYFEKDNSTTGNRIDVGFHASKKWGNDAWYFKPSIGINHTLYNLNANSSNNSSNNNTATEESFLSRTLPTLTLDSGLFFDREFNHPFSGKRYTQTLEPRLFYTYTPFKDQSNLPIFDTAQTDFSATNQLFAENRFTGKDRIADTNQLTFAVTSRIQDRQTGNELFKASIGQIFNFSNRKVTLPGGTIQTGRRSELVLELSGKLNENFKATAIALINPEKNRPSRSEFRLNYQDKKKRIANLSFHKLDSELEQLSGSASVPINNKWSLVGSFDHDLKKDRNLETLAGVEYQDCCWKTRLVTKRYLSSDNETYDHPVFLEFELKGLGNIGSAARRQLQEKIYGYDDF